MSDPGETTTLWASYVTRAISSVVGVTLMVALVVLLASVMAGMVFTFDEKLQEPDLVDEDSSSINPWSDEDALLAPEDPTAGAEDIRYRVVFEIADSNMNGDSLNEVKVRVDGVSESMFSGVTKADIEKFEVEKTDGTVIDIADDVEDESNWALQEGGSELEMTLGGSGYPNPSTGDVITIVFDGVDNPNDPGTYAISVTLNQGEDQQSGTLEIIES